MRTDIYETVRRPWGHETASRVIDNDGTIYDICLCSTVNGSTEEKIRAAEDEVGRRKLWRESEVYEEGS